MQQEFDIQKIISLITKSNANFAKRLRDVNRKHITDWEDPSKIATHKLGVVLMTMEIILYIQKYKK